MKYEVELDTESVGRRVRAGLDRWCEDEGRAGLDSW